MECVVGINAKRATTFSTESNMDVMLGLFLAASVIVGISFGRKLSAAKEEIKLGKEIISTLEDNLTTKTSELTSAKEEIKLKGEAICLLKTQLLESFEHLEVANKANEGLRRALNKLQDDRNNAARLQASNKQPVEFEYESASEKSWWDDFCDWWTPERTTVASRVGVAAGLTALSIFAPQIGIPAAATKILSSII
jgi:hypothetical protein